MEDSRAEEDDEYCRKLRESMIEDQIIARGVRDRRVIEAMKSIPRHLFVPVSPIERAYSDTPLPIGEGQTISQPYMVAWMTELLRLEGDEKVLEVGTGSGYQAAILAKLSREVYTIERVKSLAETARERLDKLGIENVHVVIGDGSAGLPEYAPYDRIIVTAGTPRIPPALVEQLAEGGRLVIPVGSSSLQMLTVLKKKNGKIYKKEEGSCVFVPLVGVQGWKPEEFF
ncbi:MAG: protein-L-isoaspartate(D-aspartate) O-methyltransferase [Actinomycetota bacterium]|nr:protein-L-isoaspartate(D-aspartate) O-methyltransferase [Actinomycetota bacterium]